MYKVLIADDETFVRNLLEKNLRASGLPIEITISAENGQEALEKAFLSPPDIVITDIAMPIQNGLELIRSLKDHGISSKNIIISGYDEFDYAKKAIALGVTDYLLKPFMPEELISVFEKIIHDLDSQKILHQNLNLLMEQVDKNRFHNRSNMLRSLLDGAVLSKEQISQLEFPMETPTTKYMTCLLSLIGTIWDFRLQEEVESFFKLIQTGYFSEALIFYVVSLEPSKLILCFCSQIKDEQIFQNEILKGIEKLSKSLMQYYDITVYASLGRSYHALNGLKNSYEDALMIWKEALNPEKRIRIFGENQEELKLEESDVSDQIKNTKSCIRGAVMNGNREEALGLTHQLMNLYVSISNKGSEYILVSAGELIYGVADDMERNGFGKVEKDHMPAFSQNMVSASLLELRGLLENYLIYCCQKVSENLSQNRSEIAVHMVQNYLEEHLKDHTISIESAAKTVHFSVSYLRQIFKEVTGESFNEYLIRKRMEKAGELLQNTSMKISDIAESCGYENQRYFASSTPTDFKLLVAKEHLY
mgnify:FL=1